MCFSKITKGVNTAVPLVSNQKSSLYWIILNHVPRFVFQDNPPYDKGAFRIEITFPAEYPFKPPKITFKTKIYHPNIDEKGQVCLPVISAENWKPATKTDQGTARHYALRLSFI